VWENLLPHIEFAYNRVVNSTTSHTPFEVVYGFNPLTPLELLPIPVLDEVLSKMVLKKTSFIKNLHHHIKRQIERKVGKYAQHANKEHKALIASLLKGNPNSYHVVMVLSRSSKGSMIILMS